MDKSIKGLFSVVFIFIPIIYLSSCQMKENTKFVKQLDNSDQSNIKYLDVAEDDGSISYGILDDNGNPETKGIYYVNEGETFTKYITIDNHLGKDIQASLIMLNTYEQEDFIVDGDSYLVKDVYINNKSELQIPIELKDFRVGYNDIIFVIALDTECYLSRELRQTQLNLVTLRFTVFFQNEEIPKYKIDPFDIVDEACFTNIFYMDDNNNKSYIEQEVNTNENVKIIVKSGNNNEYNRNYALVIFEDWKQVVCSNKKYIIINIPNSKSISLPVLFNYSSKGKHEISAILINDIYEPYSMSTSNIDCSSRFGIVVK